MTYAEAEQKIAELRQRLETVKATIAMRQSEKAAAPAQPPMPTGYETPPQLVPSTHMMPGQKGRRMPDEPMGEAEAAWRPEMVSQSIVQAGQEIFPVVDQPLTEGGAPPAAVNVLTGLGRLPFNIAAWKADLMTNPVKAMSDMGQMVKQGLVKYGDIYRMIKGDDEAKAKMKQAFKQYPVESAFEMFMPIAALLGVRKGGKALSGKMTGETAARKGYMEQLPEGVQKQRGAEITTGESIPIGKERMRYDTETRRKMVRPERKGQEIGRPLQRQGTGREAAETGRVLQAQKEEVGKPKPVEFEPKKVDRAISKEPVGLSKSEQSRIRELTGLDKLPEHERKAWISNINEARQQKLPDKIVDVADEIIITKRPLTATEHAAMVDKAVRITDQYDAAIKKASELAERGNRTAARIESQRAEVMIDQLDKLTEASRYGRREAARTMSIGRMRLNRETYDLAHVVQRAQVAKGSKLSAKEHAKFKKMTADYAVLEEKLRHEEARSAELEAKYEKLAAEKITKQTRQRAKIEKRKARLREKLAREREDIKKQLTDIGYRVNDITGVTGEGAWLVGRLAVNYIREGATSLDAVVRKVQADLPQLTKEDVWQSMLTKDPKQIARARSKTTKRITDLKTQARLLLEIERAEKGIFEPKRPAITVRPEIKKLQKRLRDLRALAYKTGKDPARLERAVRMINELQDQLANHYRKARKPKTEITPELAELKTKIQNLRNLMRTEDAIAKANEQLRTGNFDIKPKAEKPIPPELERARVELAMKRRQIKNAIREQQPIVTGINLQTAKQLGLEGINTFRTLKATADMSAVLRQGLVLSVPRPMIAMKNFGKAFKAFFDKYTAEQIDNAIRSHPNHYLREMGKLDLMDVGGKMTRGEEMFMSRVAEKIPVFGKVVRASERHMVSFLNMMRAVAFDEFAGKYPNATKAELQAWGDYVNKASGRGQLGKFSGAANVLSVGFFAPKFAVSRVQTPLTFIKHWKHPRVRKAIAKDLVTTASVGATALTLAHLAGADVGLDPRSPDWGKIKVGDTRIDIWAGFQQPIRVVARIGLGLTDKAGWTGKGDERQIDPLELLYRFSSYKLSPAITLPLELYKGKTIVGEDVTIPETFAKSVVPMIYEDMRDAWRLEGAGRAAVSGGLAFFGVGVNTYSRKETTEEKIRELFKKGKKSSAKSMQTRWNNANPKDRINLIR